MVIQSLSRSKGVGDEMIQWAKHLYPIRRSLSGPGVRESLDYIRSLIPDLSIHGIHSGAKVLDWEVPCEWTLRDAFVQDEYGEKVIDINNHALHILGYSEPVDQRIDLSELDKHLYSLPDQPDAIPYATSYYERRWGFCIAHKARLELKPGKYHVRIDADLKPGVINYADLVLPGSSKKEIVFSTYICHPMMANNELSGPVVAIALAKWLSTFSHRFTYRFIFAPETLGSIIYLSQHLCHMQSNTYAGFILTCLGDQRAYSFMPSRYGNTVADRVARHVLNENAAGYIEYSFLDRGSDERQYCSPLVDLPFVSIMRSKYGEYPEYHTSKDNFDLVTAAGLEGSLSLIMQAVKLLEANYTYMAAVPGEPHLSKRGLYPSISIKGSEQITRSMMNFLAYADGSNDLLEIAEIIGVPASECANIADCLFKHELLTHDA